MGFTEDLWTAMLSDEGIELAAALDRIATDEIASAIAATDLIVKPERPCDTSTETMPDIAAIKGSQQTRALLRWRRFSCA